MYTKEDISQMLNTLENMIETLPRDTDAAIEPVGFYEDIDYNNVNPFEFLDNLAANATILKASYSISGEDGMKVLQCERIVDNIIEIQRLMREVHM